MGSQPDGLNVVSDLSDWPILGSVCDVQYQNVDTNNAARVINYEKVTANAKIYFYRKLCELVISFRLASIIGQMLKVAESRESRIIIISLKA